MDKVFFKSFHVAGFAYHEGAYVFEELKIGSIIDLKRESNNHHDENAIEMRFNSKKIGYVPKEHNAEMAAIMKAGHDIFEVVVQQLKPQTHPERQVKVAVFIKPKEDN